MRRFAFGPAATLYLEIWGWMGSGEGGKGREGGLNHDG